ncbi:MAG: response regulator transcription factor [Chitinophagaceae bacterium]|nr:MAG: response regulator transcription factor [Chitinophagaceae bacterium]
MASLRAILVDDELNSLQNLEQKITQFCPGISILACSRQPEEALELIRQHQPDVVFLDIEMPGISGLRLVEKIEGAKPKIIFTTAYNHYAVDAIRISAFDYLTKPIGITDLQNAVARLEAAKKGIPKEKIELLRQTPEDSFRANDKIAVSGNDGIDFFEIKNISRIESSGNYSIMHFGKGKSITVTRLLKDFEEMLLPYRFYRIHHSHLVNLDYIKKYVRSGQVVMQNDDIIDVSRRKKDEFLKLLSA